MKINSDKHNLVDILKQMYSYSYFPQQLSLILNLDVAFREGWMNAARSRGPQVHEVGKRAVAREGEDEGEVRKVAK